MTLARKQVEIYLRLLKSYPGDPEIRFEAADSYRILGVLLRLTAQRQEQLQESLDCYQRSLNLYASLVGVAELARRAHAGLGQTLNDRGELYRMNRSTTLALKDYNAGLEHVEHLADDRNDPTYYKLKGSLLGDRSAVMIGWDRQQEVRESASTAVDLLQHALRIGLEPEEANRITRLSGTYSVNRAIASQELGDWPDAERGLKAAIEIERKVPPESPHYSGTQWVIAHAPCAVRSGYR